MRKLQAAGSNPSLLKARSELEKLEKTTVPYDNTTIYRIVSEIRRHLSEAGVSVSALDATGESSDKGMETRIEQAVARAHLVSARKQFLNLETTEVPYDRATINHIVSEIRRHFAQVGTNVAALDPTGKSTVADMEERIRKAVERATNLSAGPN